MTTYLNFDNNPFYQIYRLFHENYIQLVYHGLFSSERADALINFFEILLGKKEASFKIQKRAFYILVEAIQNVVKHQVIPDSLNSASSGTLTFQYIDGQFMFTLKNPIETKHIDNIRKRIDNLNHLKNEELNKYYKKTLKNEILSDKGGAGLGLIEIARKSENPLNYHFLKANEDFSYFFLNMLISDPEKVKNTFPANGAVITQKIHDLLYNSGIWFIIPDKIPSALPLDILSYINNLAPVNNTNKKFLPFLSRLKTLSLLCSSLTKNIQNAPSLFYFLKEGNNLSVLLGKRIAGVSSVDLSLFNNIFSVKPEETAKELSSFPDIKQEDMLALQELRRFISRPPRIIIQDVLPKDKFVLLKLSF